MVAQAAMAHPQGHTYTQHAMYLHLQERLRSEPTIAPLVPMASAPAALHAPLYDRLANHIPTPPEREAAADFLHRTLQDVAAHADDLPENPADLTAWMEANIQKVHRQYQAYLDERKAGAPRRYFTNRAHALYFLRNVAPTKLVDGSWLYGLCAHADNSRLSDLVTRLVNPLLMLVMGVVIGGIVVLMYLPIFTLMEQVQ